MHINIHNRDEPCVRHQLLQSRWIILMVALPVNWPSCGAYKTVHTQYPKLGVGAIFGDLNAKHDLVPERVQTCTAMFKINAYLLIR